MQEDPALLAPGTALGSHRLERLLGRGGMGAVYLAFDTRLRRKVAVKVLPAGTSSGERLLREARNAAALNHPNICTVHEVGEAGGTAFISMEYVAGPSLRERIDAGSLPLEEAVRLGIQAADALAHAHERQVVHRDFKAANIILGENGSLKVVDFGLALVADQGTSETTAIRSLLPAGTVAGTPYAMAPEQVRGEAADARADVWALGVLLYEMFAGARPFTATTTAELFSSILRDPPAGLPQGVPAPLRALIARCLEKDSASRGTAQEARERLVAYADGVADPRMLTTTAPPSAAQAHSMRRVLVRPFANISPDADAEYFADGLTEELIADLSQVKSLQVISRTSAMRLKARSIDPREAALELGVDLVLDGSVRKAKRSLRITAQLVDVELDAPIWAGKFTGSDEDVFELQERLSAQIIEAMRITLTEAEAARMARRPVDHPRAYDLYLRARHKLMRFSATDLDDAVTLLREGVDLLGDNELLLATLGHAYLYYVHWGVRPDPRYLDDAQRCAEQVIARAPDSPNAHALLGALEVKRGHLQEAVRHLKRAVAADPANVEALVWLTYSYLTAGHPQSAHPLIETLLSIDPLTAIHHASLGWLLVCEGNQEEAIRHYERAHTLDPTSPLITFLRGWSLAWAGRKAEAIQAFGALGLGSQETVLGGLAAAFSRALAGDVDSARAAIGPVVLAVGEQDEGVARFLSQIYALIDDRDTALLWLEKALARGLSDFPTLASGNALYGRLREDARFGEVLSQVQRRWQSFEV